MRVGRLAAWGGGAYPVIWLSVVLGGMYGEVPAGNVVIRVDGKWIPVGLGSPDYAVLPVWRGV